VGGALPPDRGRRCPVEDHEITDSETSNARATSTIGLRLSIAPAAAAEGVVLGEAEARHQRALGALDHLAVFERLLELAGLGEARDGEIERGASSAGRSGLSR